MTEHLSRHQLEQLVAREGGTGPRSPTRSELQAHSHALGCDVCTTRKRSIETARARMLALLPAAEFAQATLARAADAPPPAPLAAPWRKRALLWVVGGAALAIAVAALLWMRA